MATKEAKEKSFDFESASLDELEAQKRQIDERIHALRAEKRESVLAQVRELLASIGETVESAFKAHRRPSARGAGTARQGGAAPKLEAKYRNPDTGESWSGRGKQPVWLRDRLEQGAKLEEFKVGQGPG